MKLFQGATGSEPSPLSLEEIRCVEAFRDWWHSLDQPRVKAKDIVVWGHGYAGTIDLLATWGGNLWLVDFKTGQDVYPEHEIQLTAYMLALPEDMLPVRLAILQIGYRKNKRGWKFTEVEAQPELLVAARTIWAKETAGQRPHQRDYPLTITL